MPLTSPASAAALVRGPAAPWHDELWLRVKHRFWLKALGVSGFVWLFFLGYFHILRNPSGPVTTMPVTWIDQWIGFQPAALGAYVSLWLYLGIAPGLLLGLRTLIAYGLWAAALCGVGLACFGFWPTAVQPFAVDLQRHPAFAMLQGVDGPGNACPSLHVATAAFTAVWIDRLLCRIGAPGALRWASLAWFLAIAYATLAVKQHVLIDVIAGLALGLLFAMLSWRFAPAEVRPDRSAYHRSR